MLVDDCGVVLIGVTAATHMFKGRPVVEVIGARRGLTRRRYPTAGSMIWTTPAVRPPTKSLPVVASTPKV